MTALPRSLQGRLVVLVLAAVSAIWLATAVMTWFDARHELDELLDGHLAQAAALLLAQAHETGDDDHGVDTPLLHRYAPRVAFQVFREGRLVLRSANARFTPMLASGRGDEKGFATVAIDGSDWRVFTTEGDDHDVRVYVGEQLRSRTSILLAVLRSMLWPMAVALPLLALAVWWTVRRGVGPLRRLGGMLGERRPQDLEPVVLDRAPSEMAPMIGALNSLFVRIGALLDAERRFTADAAHEMRTPIAAIRAQAQVALAETDDARRSHALRQTLEGCDRATRLVAQLLTLSRLEAAGAPAMMPVDLGAVARQVVAELAPKAIARNQALECDASQACSIPGDDTLLAVLVRNLVDNALRYSPPGARVTVTVGRENGRVMLAVDDSGPGMPDAERGRLGERFFRALGNAGSGSGLGWSIVLRIAAVHRLEVRTARSETLGGLAVRVTAAA